MLLLLAGLNALAAAALALAERRVAVGYVPRVVFGSIVALTLAVALAVFFLPIVVWFLANLLVVK